MHDTSSEKNSTTGNHFKNFIRFSIKNSTVSSFYCYQHCIFVKFLTYLFQIKENGGEMKLGGHTMLCRRFRVCVYEEFFFVFLHKMCRLKKVIPLAMKMLAPNSEYSQCKNGRASGCQLTRSDCILFVNKAGQQNVKDNDAFHV